jgi:PAS domain S-box-containing protein
MAVALLAGSWPGMLATVLSAVVVGYFILPPVGRWSIASSLDLAGLVLFICMGLFISLVARLYNRSRDRAAAYERELGLREKEERLRRLYDSGMIGVIYWNMDGRITDANDKFLEMVGYTREDVQAGRIDWLAMTPPEHRHLDEASVNELQANGVNAAPFEKQYIRKDGTRLPAIVAGAMLDEARADGVAFVLDMAAEEALRASEERLRLIGEKRRCCCSSPCASCC